MNKTKQGDPKTMEEIILYITSLSARAWKLRKKSENFEVISRDAVGYIKTLEFPEVGMEITEPLLAEMPAEMKKKLLRSHRYALTSLANFLDMMLRGIKQYPNLWNKNKTQIREMELSLGEFEKMAANIFQEKSKK